MKIFTRCPHHILILCRVACAKGWSALHRDVKLVFYES